MTEVTRVRRASFKLFPERGCHMAALLFFVPLGRAFLVCFPESERKTSSVFSTEKWRGAEFLQVASPAAGATCPEPPAPDARRARLAASRVYAQRLRCTEISGSLSIAPV